MRELRRRLGVSQEELAYASGMHRAYVGGVERGERNPSYTSLLRFAEALGVPMSELVLLAERLAPSQNRHDLVTESAQTAPDTRAARPYRGACDPP